MRPGTGTGCSRPLPRSSRSAWCGAVAGVAVAAAFAGVGGAHLVGGGGLVGWLLGSVCGGVGLG